MLTRSDKRNNNRLLPSFSMDDYANLLKRLTAAEYQFQKVSQMRDLTPGRFAYMRHDIDFHIFKVDKMAKVEALLGINATYYVLLTQYYNPLNQENQNILRKIRDLGHEIGLHYDLETYPAEPMKARAHLDWEVSILSRVVDTPIYTIVTHLPYKNQTDPFFMVDEYVHPHAPSYQEDLLYVSDSCRAWRDESLLTCFGPEPPRRLLLSIHPELWSDGTIDDRMTYLDRILMDNCERQYRDYFDKVVRKVWLTHPATRLHDKRERWRLGDASTLSDLTYLLGEKK